MTKQDNQTLLRSHLVTVFIFFKFYYLAVGKWPKVLPYHQEIAGLNLDSATGIVGPGVQNKAWVANMVSLFPLPLRAMLGNHGHLLGHAYIIKMVMLHTQL